MAHGAVPLVAAVHLSSPSPALCPARRSTMADHTGHRERARLRRGGEECRMAAADAPAVRTGGVWSSCSPRASARGGGIPWPEERRKTRMDKSLTRAIPSPHPSGAPTWPRGQGVSLSTVRLVTYRTCTLDGPNHIMEGQRRASACATEGAGRATGPHRPARGAQRKGWWPLPRRPHTHDETARDPSGGVGRSSDPTPRSSLLVLPSQAARGAAPPQRARGGGHRRAKKHPLLDPSRRWGALHDDTHDRWCAAAPWPMPGHCQDFRQFGGDHRPPAGPRRALFMYVQYILYRIHVC